MVKSTIVGDEGVSAFPKLMISNDKAVIILVVKDYNSCLNGFVVYSTDTMFDVGYSSTYWEKSRFSDFKGSIVLKN